MFYFSDEYLKMKKQTEKEAMKDLSSLEKRFEKLWTSIFQDDLTFIRQSCPFGLQKLPGNTKRSISWYDYQCGKVLIECQGGVFGRILKHGKVPYVRMMGHNSPKGLTKDHLKSNLAVQHQYFPFFLSEKLMDEENMHLLMRAITKNG